MPQYFPHRQMKLHYHQLFSPPGSASVPGILPFSRSCDPDPSPSRLLLGIMAQVPTYQKPCHRSLFPCCLLLWQLLSPGLANPVAPAADGRSGVVGLKRYEGKVEQLSGNGLL